MGGATLNSGIAMRIALGSTLNLRFIHGTVPHKRSDGFNETVPPPFDDPFEPPNTGNFANWEKGETQLL
jgi:hypothetical protein